jgi:hypothetical protein
MMLAACHRTQFVTMPAPRIANAERAFTAHFGRLIHINPQVENGTLGVGVRDSSMREMPEAMEAALLDSMATWLYNGLGKPRAVRMILIGVQAGPYVPNGIIWQPKR